MNLLNFVVIVVLGCNIKDIQEDRVNTALEYVNTHFDDDTNIVDDFLFHF